MKLLCGFADAIIRLEQIAYTVNEGESVEVCAVITATDSTVTAALSVVDGSATGRNSSDTMHTITLELL